MKNFKILSIFLVVCLLSLLWAPGAAAIDDPEISSPTAMVLDRHTGDVLFALGEDLQIYPASTTKVMTVLLAIEAVERGSISLYDEVTASESAMADLIADGSSAGIQPGETMTLENLLYCAMIASANEACNIIAEYVAGSVQDFVRLMNSRARELGCTHTHFANTHGLPDDNHYITAADYSLIALEAMRHQKFVKLCSTDEVVIPATNLSPERSLSNSNALLSAKSIYGSGFVYEGAQGIKTGHTSAAGYCLASAASRDSLDLVALVFGAPDSDTCFRDSTTLLDWVFDNFSYQEVLRSAVNIASVSIALGSDSDYVNIHPSTSITLLLPNDTDLDSFNTNIRIYSLENGEVVSAPVSAGQVLGEVTLNRDGHNYGTVKLVASSSVELSRMQYIKSNLKETTQKTGFKVTVISLVLLLLLYIVWVVWYRIKRLKHRQATRSAAKAGKTSVSAGERTAKADVSFFKPEDAPVKNPPAAREASAASKIVELPKQPAAAPANDDLLRDAVCVAKLADPAKAEAADITAEKKAERDYFAEFFKK